MPKRAVFERSRRELSLDVSVGVRALLVVERSSLESQSGGACQDSDTYGKFLQVRYDRDHRKRCFELFDSVSYRDIHERIWGDDACGGWHYNNGKQLIIV